MCENLLIDNFIKTDWRLLTATKVSSENITFLPSADGSSIYFLDFSNERFFVHADLETETETVLISEGFKEIKGTANWTNFVFIRSQDGATEFLSSIRENKSGKLFIVLFKASYLLQRVAIISEHWTGYRQAGEYYHYVRKSGNGDIYLIAYLRNENLITTEVLVKKIQLTDPGEITSKITVDDKSVKELLCIPFIVDEAVYFLPFQNPKENFLKIPFDGSDYSTILIECSCAKCQNTQAHSFNGEWFSDTIFFENQIFFTTIQQIKPRSVSLWSVNIKNMENSTRCNLKCEQIVQFREELPSPVRSAKLQILPDGSAFIFIHSVIVQINLLVSDNYKLEEEQLGEGTYGTVAKGSLTGQSEVAVKIMKSMSNKNFDFQSQRKLLQSAVAEAKKLKEINHKNIVKAFGYIIEEQRFLLFMELMKESVRDKILRADGTWLKEEEAFYILQQALEGLVHLHTLAPKPIVHRDIKCANLLISNSGIVKLGDFGLVTTISLTSALSTDPAFAPKRAAGTAYWQAPEVLKAAESYGRKADVWSIGCCLVEMLTGYPPYCNMEVKEWAIKSNDGTLTYDPQDLVLKSAAASISLLKKIFVRPTKNIETSRFLLRSKPQIVRPHSWEILADVVEFNRVKPLEQQLEMEKRAVEKIRTLGLRHGNTN